MNNFSRSIILIPTLNEKENLRDLLPGIFGLMPDISVLIVDDNSSDGTEELINSFKQKFRNLTFISRKKDFGYGRACVAGFRRVLGNGNFDFIVTMDADFSHDYKEVPSLLDKLKNFDVAVGSRYIKGGGVKNWNFFRKILSRFANLYVKLILGLPVMDATSGFNAYRTGSLKKLDLEKVSSDGYAFLVELKFQLNKASYSFVEHPILFSERHEGSSKMSRKVIWESVWLPWKLRLWKV